MVNFFKSHTLVLLLTFISTSTLTACGGGGAPTPPLTASATTTPQVLTVGYAMTGFSPLTPSNGTQPYTYSVTSGALPTGLNLNASSGVITGTPTAIYPTANIVFSVQDANNVVANTTSTVSFRVAATVTQGGLTWSPVVSSTFSSQPDATTLCSGTVLGSTGWRLPTQTELTDLYTSGLMNNQGWDLVNTWTSTLQAINYPYVVDLSTGVGGSAWYTNQLGVTCVK